MDTHLKIRCGPLRKLNSHHSIASLHIVLTGSNNPRISNKHHTNRLRNFAIKEAIPKCKQLYSIQACKGWAKVSQPPVEVYIQIKDRSSSCKLPRPDLSQALRAGHLHRNNLDLEATGDGQASHNDVTHEYLPLITHYEIDGTT